MAMEINWRLLYYFAAEKIIKYSKRLKLFFAYIIDSIFYILNTLVLLYVLQLKNHGARQETQV